MLFLALNRVKLRLKKVLRESLPLLVGLVFKVLISSYMIDFSYDLAHEELLSKEANKGKSDDQECLIQTADSSEHCENVINLS